MDGVINVLKPPGMTSHDVVNYIRRLLGTRRVGHAGTLDPQAAGVLPVCVGQATRLVDCLSHQDKEYMCRMVLGITTTTQDAWGEVTARHDASFVTREMVEKALVSFRGEIEQQVPAYSAVKVAGKPMYELARKGIDPPVLTRRVTVSRIELLEFKAPELALYIACSKGTYIRTLCHDLGRALKTGGHMSFLLRTRAGGFHLGESLTLEEIAAKKEMAVLPPGRCVDGLLQIALSGEELKRFRSGRIVVLDGEHLPTGNKTASGTAAEPVAILGDDGCLQGLGELATQNGKYCLKPKRVMSWSR